MDSKTIVFWTHYSWIPYADMHAVDAKTVQNFEKAIEALKSSEARKEFNRIIVSSFNEMQLNFGLSMTGELLQKLNELKVKFNYEVIVLPHSKDIEKYLKN